MVLFISLKKFNLFFFHQIFFIILKFLVENLFQKTINNFIFVIDYF